MWQFFGAAFVFAAWQVLSMALKSDVILPSPVTVIVRLAGAMATPVFWKSFGATLVRWLVGILPAYIIAAVSGIAAARSRRFADFTAPLFTGIKSVPIVAVILIALVWFKAPAVPSVAVFLAVFPTVYENSRAGADSVDPRLTQMAAVYGFSKKKRFLRLLLPSMRPFLLSAMKVCIGVGLKAAVVAELVVQPGLYSVGSQMQTARVNLQTDVLLGWTIFIVAVSFVLDRCADALTRRTLRNGGGV